MPRRREQVANQNANLPHANQNANLPHANQNANLPHANQNANLPHANQNANLPHANQNANLPDPFYDSSQMTVYTYPEDKKTGKTLTTWVRHRELDDSGDCIYVSDGSCIFEKKEIEAIKNLNKK